MAPTMLRDSVRNCEECPLGPTTACRFKPKKLEAGTQAWGQGDDELPLLFVKEGVLGVSASDAEGRELMAGVRGPRSMLGLEALRDQPARATVVALTEATVCSATPRTLKPQLSLSETTTLLDFALDELTQATRDADLRTGPALSRVARFLLRYGSLLAPGRRAPFSKRHVAALLDVRPETMSRCLRTLAEAGLITSTRAVGVKDAVKLESVASGHLLHSPE